MAPKKRLAQTVEDLWMEDGEVLDAQDAQNNMTDSQIKKHLTEIIDSLILDNNPQVLDDDIPDLLSDGEKREDAINNLIKMIGFYKEDL